MPMSNHPFEFIVSSVEREGRAGEERTPAYTHYHDIITAEGDVVGMDIIIDSQAGEPAVRQRLTDRTGATVETLNYP